MIEFLIAPTRVSLKTFDYKVYIYFDDIIN